MAVSLKRRILIEVFIILILTSLCLAIYYHSKDLTCNKCIIKFKQDREAGKQIELKTFEVHPDTLYNNLQNNTCSLIFDRVGGFRWMN